MSTNKDFNLIANLALEERPNSYIYIDLSLLDIMESYQFDANMLSLEAIDALLCDFSEDEIKNSIKSSNIVKEEYLEAPLVIIYKNRSLPVITKDNIDEIANVDISINGCFHNKQDANKYINKFISVYRRYFPENEEEINILQENLKRAFYDHQGGYIKATFNQLPYEGQRAMAFYYYNLNKEQTPANVAKLEKKKD